MRKTLLAAIAALTSLAAPAAAPAAPLSVLDSFRIGNWARSFARRRTSRRQGARATCSTSAIRSRAATPRFRSAGLQLRDPRRRGPVRGSPSDDATARRRARQLTGLGTVEMIDCKLRGADVGYRAYQVKRGEVLYAAEGLAGYDSALELGLRSLIADQPVKGESRSRPPAWRPRGFCPGPGRHARSRARRWPKPIAATMPAAMPRRPILRRGQQRRDAR